MGAFARNDTAKIAQDMEYVFERFLRLKERITQLGGTLSGGEQQMLAIGRALMAAPRLLLPDEPSMGLAPKLVEEIFNVITYLNRESSTTILLVEQNASKALEIANRGICAAVRVHHAQRDGRGTAERRCRGGKRIWADIKAECGDGGAASTPAPEGLHPPDLPYSLTRVVRPNGW